MDDMVGGVTLVATITTGLVAGLFYSYACSVMLALRGVDDRTFVDVMQRINVAIRNGWFALAFVGALLSTVVAAVLHARLGRTAVLVPVLAALALYLVTLGVTFAVNIPLNDRLEAAGPPGGLADPAAVRTSFERPWVRWNVVRALSATAAFGCLCWALVQHGRLEQLAGV
jgi:uncharacterized membrane protein